MSVFTKQALVSSSPAYDVYEREVDRLGYVNITCADLLGLDSGRGFYRTYKPGSVVSYALEYNECPIAAVADTRAKMERSPWDGHCLHWISQCATVISNPPPPRRNLVKVKLGMKVRFEGLIATIEADHNDNLKFVPVKVVV